MNTNELIDQLTKEGAKPRLSPPLVRAAKATLLAVLLLGTFIFLEFYKSTVPLMYLNTTLLLITTLSLVPSFFFAWALFKAAVPGSKPQTQFALGYAALILWLIIIFIFGNAHTPYHSSSTWTCSLGTIIHAIIPNLILFGFVQKAYPIKSKQIALTGITTSTLIASGLYTLICPDIGFFHQGIWHLVVPILLTTCFLFLPLNAYLKSKLR